MDEIEIGLRLLDADWLRGYVAKRTPARIAGMIDTDDLMQEIFTAAFVSRFTFVPSHPKSFEQWLTGIASRILVDAHRTAKALKRGGDLRVLLSREQWRSSATDLFQKLVSDERTPSGVFSDEEAACAVRIAVAGLSPDRRRVIEMHYLEAKSRMEIAAAMYKSDAAVRGFLYRGMRDLRGLLRAGYEHLSDVRRAEQRGDG